MKFRLASIITLSLIVFLSSCSKSIESNGLDKSHKTTYYPQGVEANELKYHYINEMDPSERYQLWMDKYSYDLANNQFSSAQIDLIQDIIGYLKEDFFEDDYIPTAAFEAWFENWKSEATIAGFSFSDQKDLIASAIAFGDGQGLDHGGVNCECSMESDWCFGSCENPCELGSSRGCGTLWSYPCDGAC